MSTKITIIKIYRNKETLRTLELQEVADIISKGEYLKEVNDFRTFYPLTTYSQRDIDGTIDNASTWLKAVPRICFAQEQENRNGERVTKGYTGLVLLEVNNLTGADEADAVRRGAGEMPQTLMAFVGADGQSVKIVCRGELFPESRGQVHDSSLNQATCPLDSDDIALFHENLYERARMIYNGQLGVTIEKLEPRLQRICYISADPKLVFNPLATPIYAKPEKMTEMISRQSITQERSDLDQSY
jgi:hypothetical protein